MSILRFFVCIVCLCIVLYVCSRLLFFGVIIKNDALCVSFVKVKKPNLAIELSSYIEQHNMWVGPRQVSVL